MRILPICLLALAFFAAPFARGETFSPANTTLKDRAFLVKLEPGVRRVRMKIQDPKTKVWEVATLSHLSGSEGFFKVRVPDDVDIEQCQVEVSMTDPFPYEFYKGKTGFSQTEAVTEVGNRNVVNLGGAGGGPAAAPGAPVAEDAAGKNAGGTPDKVQESDLWQWSGRRLYFFNAMRGLQVFDVADIAKPKRVATLRMPAVGDQMYLLDADHALLVTTQPTTAASRSLRFWWDQQTELVLTRLKGSALEVVKRIPLEGNYVESRLVGSRLYLATQFSKPVKDEKGNEQWRQGLNVHQVDFTDPANPVVKKGLSLSDQNGYFWGAVVTATPEYLLISAARWYEKEQATRSRLHVIPIAAGKELEVAAELDLSAHLKDKFKLRVQDGILTAVTQSMTWVEQRKTYIESYDLREARPRKLDALTLAPRETVFATRFDGDRLYVVTFLLKDPLFVIDLKDPSDLKVLGELDIPGWSTYLVPQGDRLLSIGLEDGRVAVSLFDVANPKRLSLLKRVYPGEKWSWSEANWDEKAVGYLPEQKLLLLPINSWDGERSRNLMQLIDVLPDTLVQRGAIEHAVQGRRATAFDNQVVSISGQELITVDATDRDKPKIVSDITLAWPTDRVLAYGNHLLQIETGYEWDQKKEAYVRVTPQNDVDLELAKVTLGQGNILGATISGNCLYISRRENRSFLVKVDPEPPKEGEKEDPAKPIERWETEYSLHLDVIDLKDPAEPSLTGTHKITMKAEEVGQYQNLIGAFLPSGHLLWYPETGQSYYNPWRWWGPIDVGLVDAPVAKAGGVALAADIAVPVDGRGWWWWYPSTTSVNLPVYDVSNKAKPALTSNTTVKFENAWETGKSSLLDGKLLLNYRHTNVLKETQAYEHQYRAMEVSFANPAKPAVGEEINIPGLIEGVHKTAGGGVVLFTTAPKVVDKADQGFSSSNALLQASIYDGTKAFLVDEVALIDGRYTPTAVHDRFVLKGKAGEKEQGLAVYEWRPGVGKFAKGSDIPLENQPYQLQISDGLLFNQDGNVIDVIALSDLPNKPRRVEVSMDGRVYGVYTNRIELNKERTLAWLATGPYGVEKLDLSGLGAGAALRFAAQNADEWLILSLKPSLVLASGKDFVGPLAKDQEWAFRSFAAANDYESWAMGRFHPANDPGWAPPPANRDDDGDGVSNGVEFLSDTDPTRAASAKLIGARGFEVRNGRRYLLMSGVGQLSVGNETLDVEVSNDLRTWTRGLIVSAPNVDSSAQFTDDGALLIPADGSWRFARLRVTFPKP